MMNKSDWEKYIVGQPLFPVVELLPGEKLLAMNFTASNTALSPELVRDTNAFSSYISNQLSLNGCRYGIGGYNEHRTVYARSNVFDGNEPRRLHLGVDIWGEAGSAVFLPMSGTVHSMAFNQHFGDYGATIIVKHHTPLGDFHTLYGHLSLRDIEGMQEGALLEAGSEIAHFGIPAENGEWPPHLHFQVILDMQGRKGDYPGVCAFSESPQWLENSPDAGLMTGLQGKEVVAG